MVTGTEHNNNDAIESIVLCEENDMQDHANISEYDSNTLQHSHCLNYMGLAVKY